MVARLQSIEEQIAALHLEINSGIRASDARDLKLVKRQLERLRPAGLTQYSFREFVEGDAGVILQAGYLDLSPQRARKLFERYPRLIEQYAGARGLQITGGKRHAGTAGAQAKPFQTHGLVHARYEPAGFSFEKWS